MANLREDNEVTPKVLTEFLKPFQQSFTEVSTPRSSVQHGEHQAASLTTSRQIVLPAGQVLDTAKLSLLREVLEHEQSLAARFVTLMSVDKLIDNESDETRALRRCAVKEMLY